MGSALEVGDVGFEVDGEAVGLAWAHDEGVVADQGLEVVDFAVVGAVFGVVADDLSFLPDALEVVLLHGAAVALGAEGEGAGDVVFGVGGGDGEHVAEAGQGDRLAHGVGEFAADGGAGEVPLDFDRTDALEDFLVGGDEVGLFVAEEEAISEAEAGDAVTAVEGGEGDLVVEGEFGDHDRGVFVIGPVEDAGAVREGEGVAGEVVARADEGDLGVETAGGVAVEEEALFFAVGFVEDDKAAGRAGLVGFWGGAGRHLHGFGEAGPLGEVARGVEVGHARGVVGVGSAFVVAEVEEAVFLVEVSLVEVEEEAAEEVEVEGFFVFVDPAVAKALEDEADAVHLTVGTGGAAESPAQAVGADEVGHHFDVALGVGAEGG